MDAMPTDAVVRWTARLFVIFYLLRLGIDAAGRRDHAAQRVARLLWTIGCVICLIHFAVSMHLVHGWSHSAAFEHVRNRTRETTGLATGVGLYVNVAFAALWLVDTILWWRQVDWSERRIPYWTVQGIFAFLMIQATVLFGPSYWLPVAGGAAIVLTGLRNCPGLRREKERSGQMTE